ncbi:hypothetical protein L2E82_24437 [Cichorium intybus]|uniref:Uncharacterized protein n=1 Tax=Cichorium intybus TaxID=13427 RepID=A0ACB9E064_CICIN|nr:hypothetical protein L2E82_24437 [Cichorium intybus]
MFVSQSNGERKRMRFREGLGFRAIGATPLDIFAMNLGFFEELRAVSDRQRRVKMLDECTEGRLGLGFRAIGATPLDIFAMNLGFFEELRAVSDRQRMVKMLDECTEGLLAITFRLRSDIFINVTALQKLGIMLLNKYFLGTFDSIGYAIPGSLLTITYKDTQSLRFRMRNFIWLAI